MFVAIIQFRVIHGITVIIHTSCSTCTDGPPHVYTVITFILDLNFLAMLIKFCGSLGVKVIIFFFTNERHSNRLVFVEGEVVQRGVPYGQPRPAS